MERTQLLPHGAFRHLQVQPVQTVQIVLHTGAKVKPDANAMKIDDPTGLLKWAAKDRALVTFADLTDVEAKKTAFANILRQWIAHLGGMEGQPAHVPGRDTAHPAKSS